MDKYEPQLVYFDWWISHPAFSPYIQYLAEYYYNRSYASHRGVLINCKHDAFPVGAAVSNIERERPDTIRNPCWRLDTGISNNTGFSVDDVRCTPRYKTAAGVVIGLVGVVSKNDGLLLNIAPRETGPFRQRNRRSSWRSAAGSSNTTKRSAARVRGRSMERDNRGRGTLRPTRLSIRLGMRSQVRIFASPRGRTPRVPSSWRGPTTGSSPFAPWATTSGVLPTAP